MATGEVELTGTKGTLLGKEGEGFKIMAGMINLSRTYNAVAALAGSRRAIIEAYQYLNHRITFGKRAVEHALVRQKFHELGSIYLADFLLVWRVIRAMDAAEEGDEREKELLRIIIPMAKWKLAESGVYIARECMELMGGNGYIEDFVISRLLRDLNVLPIWEGAGNIMILDMLRAAEKSEGLEVITRKIEESVEKSKGFGDGMRRQLKEIKAVYDELRSQKDRDITEATAKPLFAGLIRLYQMALLIEEKGTFSDTAIDLALSFLGENHQRQFEVQKPPSPGEINALIGWDY
ncbi:MAG TPA: acyl-CoA dehydrogenase family protein, partial [Balneolaceae bacterium]|nr:acyl-CoA dehydrogenase family protein [Balneolaceae bacterium]